MYIYRDDFSPLENKVIEKIKIFMANDHDHFNFYISHVDLNDYNIFGTLGEHLLADIEACLIRDYSTRRHADYLEMCVNELKKNYELDIAYIDWYTPPTADEWLNEELNALKEFIISIQPDLQLVIDETK